ncbi:MAG: DUF1573 domain-containing protein [Bacteroidales bacterium]|nr:DUF1573 domain-containing protein [Bacteroidales bacterium]MBN2750831.1 DUF1573 domain-containing protein [Bacteroidales bacterium]
MKKLVTILVALFVFGALEVSAQQKTPSVSIGSNTHDFGTIKEDDGPVAYDFTITNTGAAPLIIHRVTATCGCTTPVWTKEPIAPGGKGSVNVTYDPKGRPGPFHKTITVYTNAENATTIFAVKGNVLERKKTKEEIYRRQIGSVNFINNHISLGRVFTNKIVNDTMRLYNPSENPAKIGFFNVPKHITIAAIPQTLKPQQEGIIVIKYDASKNDDWGFVIDRFYLTINDQTIQNNFLSVSGNLEEDFSNLSEKELEKAPKVVFNQPSYDFGTVKQGTTIEYEFVFKNEGKSDLVIRKIKASCGCTTVQPNVSVLKPGESSLVKASFRTNGYTGRQSKSITVITNDPKASTVVLRLTGTVTTEG